MRCLARVLAEQTPLLGDLLGDDRWLAMIQATASEIKEVIQPWTRGLEADYAAWANHMWDKERTEQENRLLEAEIHMHWRTAYPRQRWDGSSESE